MSDFSNIDFDNMTTAQFEEYLPDLFASGDGKVSDDPRFATFLAANPDCAALVSDLETIAEHAKSLFTSSEEPADSIWTNIKNQIKSESDDLDEPSGVLPPV